MGEASSLDGWIEAARASERAGAWDQALACYEAALAFLPEQGDARMAADLLRWVGTIHREVGDLAAASELYTASLDIATSHGLGAAIPHALNCMAVVEQYRGRLDDAEDLYLRARAEIATLAGAEAQPKLDVMLHLNLGILANIRGDVPLALERYHFALGAARALDDSATVVLALNNMGMAHVDLKQWERAEACYAEAAALADGLADPGRTALIELNRAELYLKSGRMDCARASCDTAFDIFRRLASVDGQGEAHKFYGALFRETAELTLADSHLALASELARTCQNRLLEAETAAEHALVHLALGRNQEALQNLNDAHRLFCELQARREIADLGRRLDGLEDTFLLVVRAWAESIEEKDEYTAGHCQRVADFACMLAHEVGVCGREMTWFRMGAFLHDVGKIEVPTEVLNKPGKLDPDEWAWIQRHPVAGDEIVAKLNFPFDIRPIVRSHHEQWAGTGYPDGLAGEEIPLHARILCIADVYDALTSSRSYRPALPQAEALEIMTRDAGRIFDPHLFSVFHSLITRADEAAVASDRTPDDLAA